MDKLLSIKSRVIKLEKLIGKGEHEILTHEGFIEGTGETKRVSKQEYEKHIQWLKELA